MPTAHDAREHASRTCRSTTSQDCSGNARQAEIRRISDARDRVADLVASEQFWLIPIFERLEDELERLVGQEDAISRARRIAEENAARKRAA
ncbi:hypothetical protein [Roseobacter sp. GAI101]|uniref:hypothetical protein n=1 Tax=Roseobacter sp. (strain GAI101) TaxID=391589 RepID=UPI0005648F9B|nr:hypothetical protein [Roseobacter sp. GAI101]